MTMLSIVLCSSLARFGRGVADEGEFVEFPSAPSVLPSVVFCLGGSGALVVGTRGFGIFEVKKQ